MHTACNVFWKYVSEEYNNFFDENILEFGSYNINGTIRDHFNNYKNYIGIDWRPGPCVDIVGLAHKVKFDFKTKAVLSASMLEHDPFWEKSLDNMIDHLKLGGILVLTWGTAKNPPHCIEEAPDKQFHCLKAEHVINYLKSKDMLIYSYIYDGDLHKMIKNKSDLKLLVNSFETHIGGYDGYGEFNLIAFKKGFYSDLLEEDKI